MLISCVWSGPDSQGSIHHSLVYKLDRLGSLIIGEAETNPVPVWDTLISGNLPGLLLSINSSTWGGKCSPEVANALLRGCWEISCPHLSAFLLPSDVQDLGVSRARDAPTGCACSPQFLRKQLGLVRQKPAAQALDSGKSGASKQEAVKSCLGSHRNVTEYPVILF